MSVRFACALALVLLSAAAAVAAAAPKYRVIDGDTVAPARGADIRLMGYDAPEIFHFRCAQEKALGLKAKAKLSELSLPPHAFSLRYKREKRSGQRVKDKYGRSLAVARSDGVDVAKPMIAAGLAVPYNGLGPRKDWCS